jgi:hypothetical protein
MTERQVISNTIQYFIFSLTTVYPLFWVNCLRRAYIPKYDCPLGEESGFLSSKWNGHLHFAGKIFMSTV